MVRVLLGSIAGILAATVAQAGVAPTPVSEPGTAGIVAGAVVAAIAVARLRGRK